MRWLQEYKIRQHVLFEGNSTHDAKSRRLKKLIRYIFVGCSTTLTQAHQQYAKQGTFSNLKHFSMPNPQTQVEGFILYARNSA